MLIISIAQHASPKENGQMEEDRAQFTALSSVVKKMPSSSACIVPAAPGRSSVTLPLSTCAIYFHSRIKCAEHDICMSQTRLAACLRHVAGL